MEAIIPYLNFNGNATEALEFYSKALSGEVIYKQTWGESPMESSENQKDKITVSYTHLTLPTIYSV